MYPKHVVPIPYSSPLAIFFFSHNFDRKMVFHDYLRAVSKKVVISCMQCNMSKTKWQEPSTSSKQFTAPLYTTNQQERIFILTKTKDKNIIRSTPYTLVSA